MPADNSIAWMETKGDKVKIGDVVRVVEEYAKVTVTYEGTVCAVRPDGALIEIGDTTNSLAAWTQDRAGVKATLYVQPPKLPTKPGTIIKAYDVRYLEEVAFILTRAGSWYPLREGYYSGDSVPTAQLAARRYEIIFEPER